MSYVTQDLDKIESDRSGYLPLDPKEQKRYSLINMVRAIASNDFSNAGFTNVTKERLVSNVSTGINLYSGGSQATEEGQGFFAVLVRGEVQPFKTVDSKPEIATSSDSYRLSIKSNKDNDYTGTYFGLEAGVEEVTADILPEKITSDRKYDLFFHFHNDIGHTIMMNDTWYDATRPVGDEQYIDLTITTN